MTHYLSDDALADIAGKRAAVVAAQERAAAFFRTELDRAAALLDGLREGQAKLGSPPQPDAYSSGREWGHARDQHTFAASRVAREIAEAEQRVNTLRDEHTRLLAEVAPLHEAHWRAVLSAVHAAAVAKLSEAAQIAAIRQSLLMRLPQDHWHWGTTDGPLPYQVQGSGFSDPSRFIATVVGNGFGPDKSAALVAELGL